MLNNSIVIVGAKRTPIGDFLGDLAPLSAPTLASHAIKAAITQSQVAPEDIDEVFMGCVLSAGIGQAPARQAAIKAGLPFSVGATTINKMCASGMKAIMLGHDAIAAGSCDRIVAGGMENMSKAPYLLPQARTGYRLDHGELIDHLMLDGLEDAYEKGQLMGVFADNTAEKYQLSRAQQDDYAKISMQRALAAIEQGLFRDEIIPIDVQTRKKHDHIDTDQHPDPEKLAKLTTLKPAFNTDGTVTAGNASAISDGAAALVLMRQSEAKKQGITPLATLVGHASSAQQPAWFTTAPSLAIQRLLTNIGWSIDEVDLFEINEAFAVVVMAALHDLNIDHEIVNIHGGACALGHPIGASGARIVVTLIHALKQRQLKRGIAALCLGGGEATALAIEIND